MDEIAIINNSNHLFKYDIEIYQVLSILKNKFNINLSIELELILVDEIESQHYNFIFRKINEPTDIISVQNYSYDVALQIGFWHIGSLFLCMKIVELQANDYCHSIKREALYLFAHGLVHLFGYDHKNKKSEKEMNNIVEFIMQELKVSRND